MAITTIRKEVSINVEVQKVWDTMLNIDTYQQWATEFGSTASYEGSWDLGSEIKFTALNTEEFMLGKIVSNRQCEFISIEFRDMVDNQECLLYENYLFSKIDNTTTKLVVTVDTDERWLDDLDRMWTKALIKLKTLCEEK